MPSIRRRAGNVGSRLSALLVIVTSCSAAATDPCMSSVKEKWHRMQNLGLVGTQGGADRPSVLESGLRMAPSLPGCLACDDNATQWPSISTSLALMSRWLGRSLHGFAYFTSLSLPRKLLPVLSCSTIQRKRHTRSSFRSKRIESRVEDQQALVVNWPKPYVLTLYLRRVRLANGLPGSGNSNRMRPLILRRQPVSPDRGNRLVQDLHSLTESVTIFLCGCCTLRLAGPGEEKEAELLSEAAA